MSTENVMNNLAAHMAVRQVVDGYTDALNAGDWDTIESLFAKNAAWLVSVDGKIDYQYDGRREIAAGIKGLIDVSKGFVVQMLHATVVHIDSDRATARSTMESVYFLPDGARRMLWGLYCDDLVQDLDGEWRFERREWRTIASHRNESDTGPASVLRAAYTRSIHRVEEDEYSE